MMMRNRKAVIKTTTRRIVSKARSRKRMHSQSLFVKKMIAAFLRMIQARLPTVRASLESASSKIGRRTF